MENEKILQSASTDNATIEIVEVRQLEGAKTTSQAMALSFIAQSHASMKFVRIKLNGGSVLTEAGAFYYSKGKIQNNVPIGGITGAIGKMVRGAVTQEAAFQPTYSGYGEVVLEPSFSHYLLMQLDREEIIVDKGLFFCSTGDIKVSAFAQKNVSSAVLGQEGIFQTKISGTGLVVLELPVPMTEIEKYDLKDETIQVDGNFIILRSASIDFTVEKSAKGLIGSALGGEGFLSTFRGTGMIWIAPTAPVYKKMMTMGMFSNNGNMNNKQN